MALATEADVEAELGYPVQGGNISALLDDASDLVFGYLRWPLDLLTIDATTAPDAVRRVVASMVVSSLNRPAGMLVLAPGDQISAGPFSVGNTGSTGTSNDSSGSVWLTGALKQRLRPYRRMFLSHSMQSEFYGDDIGGGS